MFEGIASHPGEATGGKAKAKTANLSEADSFDLGNSPCSAEADYMYMMQVDCLQQASKIQVVGVSHSLHGLK